MLDHSLVAARESVKKDWHNIADGRERIFWNITAAVGSSGHSRPLRASSKEIKVGETGCQATLANDGRWELDRNLLKCAECLLGQVDKVNLE